MSTLALVEYGFIKELCEKVRRDKKSFAGKLKSDKNERSAKTCTKTSAIKRLLLSEKRKSDKSEKVSNSQTASVTL